MHKSVHETFMQFIDQKLTWMWRNYAK